MCSPPLTPEPGCARCCADVTLAAVFKNEVFLLRNLNHDNLLRFYGACIKPPNLCIVTELLTGSLASLLYGANAKRGDGTVVRNQRDEM